MLSIMWVADRTGQERPTDHVPDGLAPFTVHSVIDVVDRGTRSSRWGRRRRTWSMVVTAVDADDVARSLALRVLEGLPALTDELVAMILRENGAYLVVGTVPEADLWRSCHDNLARVLQLLSVGTDGAGVARDELFDAAQDTGRIRAEQAMPLDDVLGSYRLGGRLVWKAISDHARLDPRVDTDGMVDLGTRVWAVVDATSAKVAMAYHTTERRLVRADEQRLSILWEGLIQGRAVEPGFAQQAGNQLGLPVRGPYVVVVSTPEGGSDDSASWSLERSLDALGVASAWQLRATVLIGVLALRKTCVDPALAVLRRQLRGPTGASLVVQGLGEVAAAYAQADLARRTLGPVPAGFAALAHRVPEALLLGAPDLARVLVTEWLGPVLLLPAAEGEVLLETLVEWLGSGGSAARTAELVHCHRNTVINRVRRIEELTGHSLSGGAGTLELLLALRALSVIPPA
jgi:hypothetical protein